MEKFIKEITDTESFQEEKPHASVVEFNENVEDEFGPDFDPQTCHDPMKVNRFYGQSTII